MLRVKLRIHIKRVSFEESAQLMQQHRTSIKCVDEYRFHYSPLDHCFVSVWFLRMSCFITYVHIMYISLCLSFSFSLYIYTDMYAAFFFMFAWFPHATLVARGLLGVVGTKTHEVRSPRVAHKVRTRSLMQLDSLLRPRILLQSGSILLSASPLRSGLSVQSGPMLQCLSLLQSGPVLSFGPFLQSGFLLYTIPRCTSHRRGI